MVAGGTAPGRCFPTTNPQPGPTLHWAESMCAYVQSPSARGGVGRPSGVEQHAFGRLSRDYCIVPVHGGEPRQIPLPPHFMFPYLI